MLCFHWHLVFFVYAHKIYFVPFATLNMILAGSIENWLVQASENEMNSKDSYIKLTFVNKLFNPPASHLNIYTNTLLVTISLIKLLRNCARYETSSRRGAIYIALNL